MGLQLKPRIHSTSPPALGATPGAAVGLPIKCYSLTSHPFKWPVIAALSIWYVNNTITSTANTYLTLQYNSFIFPPTQSRETTQSIDLSWVTWCHYTILLYCITFCCIVTWLLICMCSICMPSSHKVYAYKYDCCPLQRAKCIHFTANLPYTVHIYRYNLGCSFLPQFYVIYMLSCFEVNTKSVRPLLKTNSFKKKCCFKLLPTFGSFR